MHNLRETLLCRGLKKPSLPHDTLPESDSIKSSQLPSNSLVQAPLSYTAIIRISLPRVPDKLRHICSDRTAAIVDDDFNTKQNTFPVAD